MSRLNLSGALVRTLSLLALSLTALVGCGEEATAPDGTLLVGEWGSETALFIALRSGAEVQLGCSVVIIDEPIALTAGQTFVVAGRLQTSSAVLGELPRIRGTGKVGGSRVVLSLPVGSGGDLTTLEHQAGVHPVPAAAPTGPQ